MGLRVFDRRGSGIDEGFTGCCGKTNYAKAL